MANAARARRIGDEQLLFCVAVVVAVGFTAGFIYLMVALNHREKAPGVPGPGDDAVPIAPDRPRQLVDFSLTDRTGRAVTRADLAGSFLVVDFLFTSCSLTCPAVNRHMAQIQQLTMNQPDVKLISLTVDPRDDTTAVLAQYGQKYGADTNRWWLLTGDKSVLYHLIGTTFLNADLDDPLSYMPGNFSHTERVVLVDGQGHVRSYFDGLSENVAAAVVAQIGRLRQ